MKRICLTLLIAVMAGRSLPAAESPFPTDHPRLLMTPNDVAALRVKAGIGRYKDDPVAQAHGLLFGVYRDEVERLKVVASRIMVASAHADDLAVPAMLHLITGELDRSDSYSDYITTELLDPKRLRFELDELLALDWCWTAIDPDKRDRICEKVAQSLDVLNPQQSPLEHLTFSRKLNGLAAAIILKDPEYLSTHIDMDKDLDSTFVAAEKYVRGTLMEVCRQRGAAPTSGENGIWEEADISPAFELWRSITGENLLKDLHDSFGRSMEHYFYADTEYKGLAHGFIHDDGSTIPLRPGQVFRGFAPAVPWVIARSSGDPVAAGYAHRSLPISADIHVEQDRYQWVKLLYGPIDTGEVARRACPLARNFGGGLVAMRSGWQGGDTVLFFDVGQPFWRSRQHYDAGQFQIYRKGRLAIDSGDDVTFEAVTAKDGKVTIGGRPGDWDDYFQSTIAHNCVTVSDTSYDAQIYGRPWPAMGNQRLIERNYSPNQGDIFKTPRNTGTLAAFETNSFYSYAAADLSRAYPRECVRSLQRQILFASAGMILVLDRVDAVSPRSTKTWHLQLPSRPKVESSQDARRTAVDETLPGSAVSANVQDVSAAGGRAAGGSSSTGPGRFGQKRLPPIAARQIHGVNESAGIWELTESQDWFSLDQQEGRLFVRTLLPLRSQRRLLGGPMEPRQVPDGSAAETRYYGGDALGYEYRLWPASNLRAPNAAYELGRPTGLGPQFGVGAAWGRYDVTAIDNTRQLTFLHVLIPTDASVALPPPLTFDLRNPRAMIHADLPDQKIDVELDLETIAGHIHCEEVPTGKMLYEKELSTAVQPSPPLAIRSAK